MLTMYKQITIKTLDKQGLKQSEIAKQLGCHRHTIANVLQRENFIEKQTRAKGWLFDPYQTQIQEWIANDISILRMFEILTETYKVRSTYVNLCKYIQARFPKQQEAFGVQVTAPGEVAEIDFGYVGMFSGPSGKLVKTYGLAVILPYSRLDFYAITYDQKLETLIKELENAFTYFCGVPKRLKVDNMKTAILKNQHYDLEFNQDFLEFAYHYHTVIIPCTPYSPQQKGTVESGIKYLQGNFISGRTFQDHADMKRQLRNWMDNYANQRVHGTTRKVPVQVFLAEEKGKLQPLPDAPFSFFNRGVRIVASNCHVHFANNYYSVPSCHVGKEVTIRWNEHLLRIIHKGEQVALHMIRSDIGVYVTQRAHMPDYKVYSQTEHQARFEAKFANMGEDSHQYFRHLLKKEPYWFRIVRSILGLREHYGDAAVNASLKRALYYHVRDVATIKNILEKRLYVVEIEPKLLDRNTTENILIRELTYYTTSV
ncbi:MAG: integrase catalytic subunit [uncultured bacterium]|nr:MAG: integrase catalytic subunit [uncultured bacterium]